MTDKTMPGDNHYRAFVGDPHNYDLISAVSFQLLTLLGLRDIHSLLDVGCGSLRSGRLLIPYLNSGNYYGLEPNRWLVDEGIKSEVGESEISLKTPSFSYCTDLNEFSEDQTFDYVLLQSIFSHCGADLVSSWLDELIPRMDNDSILIGTYFKLSKDSNEKGWLYPGLVSYRKETFSSLFNRRHVVFNEVSWPHPIQQWFVVTKTSMDLSEFSKAGEIFSNVYADRWHRRKKV